MYDQDINDNITFFDNRIAFFQFDYFFLVYFPEMINIFLSMRRLLFEEYIYYLQT